MTDSPSSRNEGAGLRASFRLFESDLPQTAQRLVQLVGWEKTFALLRALGGVSFPVPMGANNNPSGAKRFATLAEIVGEVGAATIVEEYGGDVLYIPNIKTALRRAWARAVVDFYSAGATLEETALAFGLTSRRVSYICKEDVSGHGEQFEIERSFTGL